MNALNAYNKLNANVAGLKKSSEKLSSGYRINRAGDDAAGLAVSEKMRSQIRGLNQAVRNSQDGINMIQTFEGAAQETHSILQRMKELAEESATGTYDNYTDRAAMQLEFDQLNDELNQIADTDFNGTIVLNGGEMSDGLKAVDGEFNYGNKKDQIDAKIADLKSQIDKLNETKAEDIKTKSVDGTGIYKDVDENNYDIKEAQKIWNDLGLDPSDVKSINVTWTATVKDGVATYEVSGGELLGGEDGKTVLGTLSAEKLKTLFAATPKNGDTTTSGSGGFTLGADVGGVNVLFDATKLNTGDSITLNFEGPGVKAMAPKNAGFADDAFQADKLDAAGKVKLTSDAPTVKSSIKDEQMDADMQEFLKALEASGVKFSLSDTGAVTFSELGGADLTTAVGAGTAGAKVEIGGKEVWVTVGSGKITINDLTSAGAKGTNTLLEIDFSTAKFENTSGAAKDDITAELKFSSYVAPDATALPDVSAVETTTISNDAIQKQIDELQAQIDALSGETKAGVSKSDAFDKSTARMTYTDNITLQVGARTKDAVNFTFNYNTDKSADMGGLDANLNLSSRKEGLNTASLSLRTAEDANYAIDQIDKAINKTSMVRASFGAIQNRLEHKITNLTTTSENLTEAEAAIRDTDMASEMMNYTKFNILQQAAQSMLAQANQQPQSILQLLG